MLAWYFYSAFAADQVRFGFDQLKSLGFPAAAALLGVIVLVIILTRFRDRGESIFQGPLPYSKLLLPAAAVSFASVFILWHLRTGFINADGLYNMVSMQAGMRIIHHDEMLSSLLVQLLWKSGVAGVRPEDTLALFSVAWGSVYVWTTVILGGRLTGKRWPLFLLLCFSSGFVQLFFGDVEFYAMVAALINVYMLLSLEHLRGNISILFPGIALAIAICTHLLAGWILPSYLYLLTRAVKKGKAAEAISSIPVMLLIIGLIFITVSDAGLPVHTITQSHALGSADRTTLDMLAVPSLHYHAAVGNVLFLLFPFWPVIPLLFIYRRLRMDPFNITVLISTGMLLLLALVWNLGLGPYFDWNLIASVGVTASVLVWGNMLNGSWKPGMRTALMLLLLAGAFHSWAWIAGNHFVFSMMPREQIEKIDFPSEEPARVIPFSKPQTDSQRGDPIMVSIISGRMTVESCCGCN